MEVERMKNKSLGSWLCLIAAVLALITAVVFLNTQAEAAPLGHADSAPGFVLLLGAVAGLIFFLIPVRFAPLIEVLIYSIALRMVVVQLYFVFADIINKVTFAGGNAGLCVFYMAATFVVCLLTVIACFCKQTKDQDEPAKKSIAAPAGAVALVAVASLVVFFLVRSPAGLPGGAGGSGTGGETENLTMAIGDNTFANMSIEELGAIPREAWVAKEANGEVVYFFEGQYTEGFGTIVDPACLDMYLCKDGSMYGSLSGPDTSVGSGVSYVYGYWYNVDENGEDNFVIHLTGNQNLDGSTVPTNVDAGADADVFIFETDHGSYNWEASLSYGLYGGMMTRNINIYGQKYAPATSLTIDNSALPVFYTGDALDAKMLDCHAVRATGTEEFIWNGRLNYTGYDSSTPGTKTVTGSFLGASATFDVVVEELVTETYTGEYELIVDNTPTAKEVSMLVDYSHKTITVMAADGSAFMSGTLVEASEGKLVAVLNNSSPLDLVIADGKITIPAHQETVMGWFGPEGSYDIGEAVLTIAG